MPPNEFHVSNTVKIVKFKQNVGDFHQFEKSIDQQGRTSIKDKCSVDIIIPYHCCYDSVRRALLSIIRFTHSNPYQVTLVDDGSPSSAALEFINTIKQAPQTKCLRLDKQMGFGAAVMEGISKTHQPYVCVLHSDCEIRHMNWLESMGVSLVQNKQHNIRLVSPLTNNPGDVEAKEILQFDLNAFNKDKKFNTVHVLDKPLPLYCFMCHRDLFKRIGSIKKYPYKSYEDDELFYRMQRFGMKQAVCANSWIHHVGSVTLDYVLKTQPNARQEINKNRERCISDLKAIYSSK